MSAPSYGPIHGMCFAPKQYRAQTAQKAALWPAFRAMAGPEPCIEDIASRVHVNDPKHPCEKLPGTRTTLSSSRTINHLPLVASNASCVRFQLHRPTKREEPENLGINFPQHRSTHAESLLRLERADKQRDNLEQFHPFIRASYFRRHRHQRRAVE